MIPDHVSSRVDRETAGGWLIDGFGAAHPIAAGRTLIGRRLQSDLVVLAPSVSRDHAELTRNPADEGWEVRDLGSRNATTVDGHRVQGRAAVPDGAPVRFGEVPFLFVGRALRLDRAEPRSIETAHAADTATFRYTMRGTDLDLCLLGSADAAEVGGALLYRAPGGGAWAELNLSPLEFQLLRVLAGRAIREAGSPSRSRGCVPTKQLAQDLPFRTRWANDENVRQVVRRLRGTLERIGGGGLVEALPGRGYYITWTVLES